MPEGRRVLTTQPPVDVPKREDIPKLTRKQLAEYIYDLYIETSIVDPKHGVGKDEWVRRMLNGAGAAKAAKKDELVRQLGSILDEREGDMRYIDAYVAENGLESLRERVRLVLRFSRNTLETELDARDDTAIPDERNASLSSYTTSEITELVEHYTAYRRPYATQLVNDWEASMAAGEIDYRAAVEGIIEREYQNRPNYLDNSTSALIHSFFVRQREEGLEYLDERQYQALYQSHMDGDNILECLGQEYETNFEGRLTSDEDITRLIEQFTYTYYSDVLIDRKIVSEQIPEMAEIMAIYSNNHPRSVYDARLEAQRLAIETWEPYISIESAAGKSIAAGAAWFKPGMILPLSEAEKQFTSINAAFVKAGVKEEIKINIDFVFEKKLVSITNFSFTFGNETAGLVEAVENHAKVSRNHEIRDYAIYFAQHKDLSALEDKAIAEGLPLEEQYNTQGYVLAAREAVDTAVPFSMYSLPEMPERASQTADEEHRENSGAAPREALRRAVQEEFDSFKAEEMKKSPEEVFGNMLKIRFYTEVANFFSNEENVAAIPDAAVAALYSESPSNLSLLYDYYLKQEYAGVENSEQVRELVDGYIERYFPESAHEATERPAEELLQEPLYGLVYNWKGLKEENYVYTAAQLGAEDPDFDPTLDVQDGAFSANKTYIVYKLNGATVEETAANVKAFMTGSKNFEAEQAPLIPGWYWETMNYNLFTCEVNPTAEKLIAHFGLTDENLRMQEEELFTIEELQEKAQELVESTGKPHVLIEWSESGEVPNETIMTLEEADRHLRALNAEHSEEGYYETKLHVYYQDVDGIGIYGDMRYDIGTERGGIVDHIEDFATNPLVVQAHFTNPEEQKELQRVVGVLREYLQSVNTEENLEKAVAAWREGNDTLLREGKEPVPFPDYVAIPYRQFSVATAYSCFEDELSVWSREHQNGNAAQKQWIVDYLEDINFHTEADLLADGKYDELQKVIERRHIEYRLDSIYDDGASLAEIETRINLASKYTLEQLQSEIDWRAEHDAGRYPQNEDLKLRSELSDVRTKDLYEVVKDYDVYSHSFAPQMLRVYKNFSGAPLPEEEEQPAPATTAAEEPKLSREPKQKQNIKSLLGGKYNAEELQRFLSKELEENALKNERSQQEFIAFLASFRSRQYSVRNQLMLYIQAAQNGYLPVFGTFEEWKGKGTSIQPGSHGLTICRPIFTDVYYTVDVEADGEVVERRYRKFGLSEEKLKELEKRVKEGTARKETELTSFIYTDSVFSMSQTTMTEEQRIEYLQRYNAQNTSTENEALYGKLQTVAAELGRTVVEKTIKGEELGWVERFGETIVIKEDMPVDAKVSVLLHEIGHKLLHIQNATAENRAQKEVQAQLFSHLAMLKLGIDAEKQFSLSYINNWLKASEKNPPVFDADGKELSRGEVLQLNLAAVIPAVDALLKAVGENDQAIDAEALKALKDYKADQKPQAEPRKPRQKEEKVEIEPLRVVKSTDKAVMVKLPGANPEDPKKGVWLPRSRISTNKDGYVYEATPSLIKEKGLTPKGTLAAVKGAKAQRSLKI